MITPDRLQGTPFFTFEGSVKKEFGRLFEDLEQFLNQDFQDTKRRSFKPVFSTVVDLHRIAAGIPTQPTDALFRVELWPETSTFQLNIRMYTATPTELKSAIEKNMQIDPIALRRLYLDEVAHLTWHPKSPRGNNLSVLSLLRKIQSLQRIEVIQGDSEGYNFEIRYSTERQLL